MEEGTYLQVTITYNNGVQDSFNAQDFDIKLDDPPKQSSPCKFSYTGMAGEERALYLTPNQVSGISVSDMWRNR